MNFIIWIVVGGILGWIASMIMRTDAQQGMLLNIVVGIIGALLGGSIVVEAVFNWPGLGRLLVDAVTMRDYPVIQALVLL
ncbi:MAG: ABC transporter permease subunit, partial [Lacisediminimonas sp.]|nr:ABC transporter permease subunit [Lacisediminimonas sp.]